MTVTLIKPVIKVSDAGVWLSGANWGWRISAQAVRIAQDLGMTLESEDISALECHVGALPCGPDVCSCGEYVDSLATDAERWLNERAPDRYAFTFHDGDFVMWEYCPETGEWTDECPCADHGNRPVGYCKHGTYVGHPWGPDYLCGMCENGD